MHVVPQGQAAALLQCEAWKLSSPGGLRSDELCGIIFLLPSSLSYK